MSAKTEDLSSRIQTLQERLEEVNNTRDNVNLPPFRSPGFVRRPNNCKIFFSFFLRFSFYILNKRILVFSASLQ